MGAAGTGAGTQLVAPRGAVPCSGWDRAPDLRALASCSHRGQGGAATSSVSCPRLTWVRVSFRALQWEISAKNTAWAFLGHFLFV